MNKRTMIDALREMKQNLSAKYDDRIDDLINGISRDIRIETLLDSDNYKMLSHLDGFCKDKIIKVYVHKDDYYEITINRPDIDGITRQYCQGLEVADRVIRRECASSETVILEIRSKEVYESDYAFVTKQIRDRIISVWEHFIQIPNAKGLNYGEFSGVFGMQRDYGDVLQNNFCGMMQIQNVDYKNCVVNVPFKDSKEILDTGSTTCIAPKEIVTVKQFKNYEWPMAKELMFEMSHSSVLGVEVVLDTDDGKLNETSIIEKFYIKNNNKYGVKYVEDFLSSMGTYGIYC